MQVQEYGVWIRTMIMEQPVGIPLKYEQVCEVGRAVILIKELQWEKKLNGVV